jgi:thiosulfate/3-mercaptopyruvate sulfurtransferase
MARLGIGDDSYVVAYDDGGGSVAARLWWLLRHFGHDQVSVLNGGIAQWRAEGRPVETETQQVATATFTPQAGRDDVVDKDVVRQLARDPSALVLDARAPERYEGRTEPVDPRAGHIPGARNAPVASNLTTDRPGGAPRFKTPEELRTQYEALGAPKAQKVIAYCGSGVNACHTLLALHLAGYPDGLLYAGSWSDWSSDPTMEAATGPEP